MFKNYCFLSLFLCVFIFISSPGLGDVWWNSSWSYRIPINLTEPIGIDRELEPIDIWIDFEPNPTNCTKEIRVIVDNKEIPSQVYNESYKNGECDSANVVWLANVNENSEEIYWVYFGNEFWNYRISMNLKNTTD